MDAIVDHPLFPFTLQNPYLQHMYELRGAFIDGYEPAFCNLRTRILNNPVLRARLLATLEKAWKELLDPAVLTPWIEQTHAALAPHMKDDPWVDPAQFAFGREFLTDYANRRFAFVRDGMAAWKARRPGLVIEQFDPAGGSIVLRNRSEAPVSTSGLVLTPSLRRSLVPPNVPARDLAPGEGVAFSQAELGLSFGSRGEIGLFDGQTVSGVIDLLFYGELSPGQRYVRADDPEGTWQIR